MMKDDQVASKDSDGAGEVWSIGADASLQAVLESPGCPPLLRQTLTGALTWQDRNRRVIRRAVASPNVAPHWSTALLALGATVTLEGEAGAVEIPVETLLAQRPKGEVTALHVRTAGLRWGEAHVSRTPADEPIVAAIAAVEMEVLPAEGPAHVRQARVALTGAGPLRLAEAANHLVGGPLDEERVQAVAEATEREVAPQGDFRGSEEYRRAMAGVLTRRALQQCLREQPSPELAKGGDHD
jgi:CO/xanthine dehydrogenase FAD-binding subunit